MNYQYIEQLLDRYWKCETTLEEEQILRSFFSQDNVPSHLQNYAPLFAYTHAEEHSNHLGNEFDQRINAMTNSEATATQHKAMTLTLRSRLAPLLKAAAVVAVVVAVGNITERTLQSTSVEASADMMATDTYIKQEDITAQIKVIDQHKSEAIARTDSIQSQVAITAGGTTTKPLEGNATTDD